MKHKIIPTIIAKNQGEINSLLDKYKNHFEYFQIDVMDGKFVKNKSNWFNLKLPKKYKYEAHLMVDNPGIWIKNNYKKFEVVIANFERLKEPFSTIKFLKSKNNKIGFAINPETSIKKIEPYLHYLDLVLVLAVHPGKYGANFLQSTFKKIKDLRKIYKKDIEVDGHIDPKTIKLCKKAGANLFAVGSYLKNSNDIGKSKKELSKK